MLGRTIGVALLASCALSGAPQAWAVREGALTLTLENDTFTGSDNNYTSGLGLAWVSGAVRAGDEGPLGRWARFWSFLPLMKDERYTTYASWALAHEMNTPNDIKDPNPSTDDQPYSGILSLDSILYLHRRDWTHAWQLKLGVVGPAWNLVDALGVTALRSGLNAASTVGVGRLDEWSVSVFGGVGAYAVGRYLPLDGTLFRDSRAVNTRHRTDMTSAGLCVRRDGLTLSVAWNRFRDVFNIERRSTDFGTMSLSWLL